MECKIIRNSDSPLQRRLRLTRGKSLLHNSGLPLNSNISRDNVTFQGLGSTVTKKSWFYFKNLADYMKDVSEITNAFIAAIGTGIIAPAIILVSPGKGDKEDQDKKFFQAIRQPLSAGLALAFQLPMTMFITRTVDKLAYKYKLKMFRDDVLGDLIPDKKYLQKNITYKEYSEWEAKFDDSSNGKSLRQELEEKIKEDYRDSNIELTEEQLKRKVEKKKTKFLKEKIADQKHRELINKKAEELKTVIPDEIIENRSIVTENYRNAAIHINRQGYDNIGNKIKLSWFDKTIKLMGFSNKKIADLEKAQREFSISEGLKLLQNDESELFSNSLKKLIKYVENKDKEAQKLFKGKRYWLSLLANLFMVSASCYALNWAHPRLKELIDKYNHKNTPNNQQLSDDKKVEVK